jgi:hypothetical protein
MLILNISREAKKTGQKKRLRTLKDLDWKAFLLTQAFALLLDENTYESALRKTIFKNVPVARIVESVDKVNELARPQQIFRMKWWNSTDG